MAKNYEREVELYAFLEELGESSNQTVADLARKLKKSLWQVLHVATKPPGSWQEEAVRPIALTDLAHGNTFKYCVSEMEKFTYEYPLLATTLRIKEKIDEIKSP